MTPIERAAKALYERAPLSGSTPLPHGKVGLGPVAWADIPAHERGRFIRHARAVLLAIRDEADELCGDAYRVVVANRGESETVLAREVFRTMIDAALADEVEAG